KNPVLFAGTEAGSLVGIPVAILIDGGTAGGAEIVAAALSFHHIGKTCGQETFGYVFDRTKIPVNTGGTMSIVDGVYHDPAGKKLYPEAVIPDIPIQEALSPSEWQIMLLPERTRKDPVLKKALDTILPQASSPG
ncbi:S41 family peptidase, partial [candidate division CSSED10-310 bacterium]